MKQLAWHIARFALTMVLAALAGQVLAEGVIVETGAVLAMGTFIGATTKIVDRDTGQIHMGRVPAYSVVVPGSLPGRNLPDGSPGPSLYCAVIVKKVDDTTISTADDVAQAISAMKPGDKVKVTVDRNGHEQTIEVTLGTRPDQVPGQQTQVQP